MAGVGLGVPIFSSFLTALVLVPALALPARHLGLIDHPDHRKRHSCAVPLTGGLAMFAAYGVSMLFYAPYYDGHVSLMFGMTVLLIVGIADDLLDLRAAFKLLIQVAVASIVVMSSGLELNHLGQILGPAYGQFGLGPLSIPFSVLCIVFMINVLNMSDGLDGLAGGIGVISLGLIGLVAWLDGAPLSLVLASLTLATATAGFLIWNMRFPFRKKASAFMGDAGSMMLGFAIAWLAIAVAKAEGSSVYPISIAWILLVPCIDTIAVSVRRMRQGKSPMSPDRSHLHHVLRRCHLSVTSSVAVIHAAVLASGLIGILAWQFGWPQWLLFLLAATAVVGYTAMLLNAHRVIRWAGRRRRTAAE